jgi:hypothetical protein
MVSDARPEIANAINTMCDQANQNPKALVVLREAFRRNHDTRWSGITRR